MSVNRKKLLMIGGLGVIGNILNRGLSDEFDIYIVDLKYKATTFSSTYLQIDISDFGQMMERIPSGIDVIINLAGLPEQPNIVEHSAMMSMNDVYAIGSYNVYLAAVMLGIPRVVFASTNHVTDSYEKDGGSLLNREITVQDYPRSNSMYGAMKLYGEQLGYVFTVNTDLSVICLRIGTVRFDEKNLLLSEQRARHTLLSHVDLIEFFRRAIETPIKFGVYYAVSDNVDKPWSIENALHDLDVKLRMNSDDFTD